MGMKHGFIKLRVVLLALDSAIVQRPLERARPPRGPLLRPICHPNCKINSDERNRRGSTVKMKRREQNMEYVSLE